MARTRAIQILEKQGITHDVRSFEAVDFTAEEVANKLSIPLQSVFKTLVARGETKGVVMALVAGDKNLSLKKLAKAMGDKGAQMVQIDELEKLTGYLKGGCSPLGAKKDFPVFIDQQASMHEKISISAGMRGVQILISLDDLRKAVRASVVDL